MRRSLSPYEKGQIWYYSNANTRVYRNRLLHWLDRIGKHLAFFNTQEYETLTRQNHEPLSLWGKIKAKIWGTGIGRVLGWPGAILRWAAALLSLDRNVDTRHYKRKNMTLCDYSHSTAPHPNYQHVPKREKNKTQANEVKGESKAQATEEVKAETEEKTIRFLSLNVACLPYNPKFLDLHINGGFLRPNRERVEEIADQILQEEKPDVISLQEVFDKPSGERLIHRLKHQYPYVIKQVGTKFLNLGSGLMILSKYPIIDSHFQAFNNQMVGEETLANKGFLACKLQISNTQYCTVYNTHLHTPFQGIFHKLQTKLKGSLKARRNAQFGKIIDHLDRWEKLPPPGNSSLQHLSTHVMGDLNTQLNCEADMLSRENHTGMFQAKMPQSGQYRFFNRMQRTIPQNFVNVLDRNPNSIVQSVAEDKFTGTCPSIEAMQVEMKQRGPVSKRSTFDLIDTMEMTRSSNPNLLFKSKIVSFQNSTDHFGLRGTLKLRKGS